MLNLNPVLMAAEEADLIDISIGNSSIVAVLGYAMIFVGLILLFPHAILHEAGVSFLGYGLPPEQPAIGIILSESMKYLSAGMWWTAVFPGILLVAIVLLVDKLGDSLRMVLDPYSAQE